MKTAKRVLFYISLFLGALVLTAVISVFLFKDRIIQQFISEANKQLNTKIDVKKIDVSWFEDFPNLSLVLYDVSVEDSHKGLYPLLTARTISFQLNISEVVSGTYVIKGLRIRDSETNLKIDEQGVTNYAILKSDGHAGSGSVTFSLKDVLLENNVVNYTDKKLDQEHRFSSGHLRASIDTKNDLYTIITQGDVTTGSIRVRKTTVFENKTFQVKAELLYDDKARQLTIRPSQLQLRQSAFRVNGTYEWKDKNRIDMQIDGEDTDIQTLLSFLPESASGPLEKYRSKGDIYFNALLKGEVREKTLPSLSVRFGFRNATLYHPDYKSRIESANMEGSFATSDLSDPRQAVLVLKNIGGTLNDKSFEADLVIQNFQDSDVKLSFKGSVDASSVFDFYPVNDIRDVKGTLDADLSFEGRLSWLKSKATATRASTQGTVELHDLALVYGKESVPIKNLTGALQFSNNDLALSNVSGLIGNSDVLLNGFFKNIITFILFENQPIGIETDLTSQFIDLDQLFALVFGTGDGATNEYAFSISRNINLNFNCDVKSLRYKRFRARNLKGDLLVKNEMAVSRSINMQTMGGQLQFSGIVDAKNPKAIDVVSTMKLDGLHVDSVFYVFENFDQDFIQDKHLKGRAVADVTMEMTLNPSLKLFSETLIADIRVAIKGGELNDFDPLRKLNKYLDDDELHHVRFSDLANDIHIEKKTIYIPQMEVRTNVTNMLISGTHTFDQQIDYRVVAPLRSYKKINLSEAGSAIESDSKGQSKIYLKIQGTTDNYRVTYDVDAVRKKIATDLKNEVKELKEAFKNKGTKKQKELELEEDDYFDWDNP